MQITKNGITGDQAKCFMGFLWISTYFKDKVGMSHTHNTFGILSSFINKQKILINLCVCVRLFFNIYRFWKRLKDYQSFTKHFQLLFIIFYFKLPYTHIYIFFFKTLRRIGFINLYFKSRQLIKAFINDNIFVNIKCIFIYIIY